MPRIGQHFMPNMHRASWGFMQSGDFPVPVLHLKFGKNTGTVAYDSSPSGLNGVIEGATWVKGALGPGLSFDNLDDHAYVPDNDLLDSIVCFVASVNPVKEIDDAISNHIILAKHLDYRNGLYLNYGIQPNHFRADFYDGETRSAGTWEIPAYNTMYRVVSQFKDLKGELYVNGELKQTGNVITGHEGSNNYPVRVGGGIVSRYTRSIIDEILCFDTTLTAAQIWQDAQGFR